MSTIDELEKHIEGLRARLKELRGYADLHEKARIYRQEISETGNVAKELSDDTSTAKDHLNKLVLKRRDALVKVADRISSKMAAFLPSGEPYIDLEDRVHIGWTRGGNDILFHSLSGGEQVVFGAALCNALVPQETPPLIIVEAGEADDRNLIRMLNTLTGENPDAQIICNTWHLPADDIPDGWVVVERGAE